MDCALPRLDQYFSISPFIHLLFSNICYIIFFRNPNPSKFCDKISVFHDMASTQKTSKHWTTSTTKTHTHKQTNKQTHTRSFVMSTFLKSPLLAAICSQPWRGFPVLSQVNSNQIFFLYIARSGYFDVQKYSKLQSLIPTIPRNIARNSAE